MSGNAGSGPLASWDCESGQWLDASGTSGDLFGQSVPFSGRWPASVSMRKGSLYPQPKPERRTSVTESSSSPGLLPTPAAGNFNDGESLESWEARRQANLAKGINGNGQGTPLAIAAQQLLPTPQAHDAAGAKTPEQITAMRSRGYGVSNLNEAAAHLLKTPTAQLAVNGGSQHPDKRREGGQDGKGARASSSGYGLRNTSRAISRGDHTNSPSAAGSAPSAGRRHVQLSLDGQESA